MSEGLEIRYTTTETIVPSCIGVCFPETNTYDKALQAANEYKAELEAQSGDNTGAVYIGVHGRCQGYNDRFIAGLTCGMEYEVTIKPIRLPND